jgi:hypothetical protein
MPGVLKNADTGLVVEIGGVFSAAWIDPFQLFPKESIEFYRHPANPGDRL